MTTEEFNRIRLDMLLEMFDKSPAGAIEKTVLFSCHPAVHYHPIMIKRLGFL